MDLSQNVYSYMSISLEGKKIATLKTFFFFFFCDFTQMQLVIKDMNGLLHNEATL